jgi:hypothetical protein
VGRGNTSALKVLEERLKAERTVRKAVGAVKTALTVHVSAIIFPLSDSETLGFLRQASPRT